MAGRRRYLGSGTHGPGPLQVVFAVGYFMLTLGDTNVQKRSGEDSSDNNWLTTWFVANPTLEPQPVYKRLRAACTRTWAAASRLTHASPPAGPPSPGAAGTPAGQFSRSRARPDLLRLEGGQLTFHVGVRAGLIEFLLDVVSVPADVLQHT